MKTVTLIDGRRVDSASEAWRHECEARHVANLPSLQQRQDYLASAATKRGTEAHGQLAGLVASIFKTRRKGAQA